MTGTILRQNSETLTSTILASAILGGDILVPILLEGQRRQKTSFVCLGVFSDTEMYVPTLCGA